MTDPFAPNRRQLIQTLGLAGATAAFSAAPARGVPIAEATGTPGWHAGYRTAPAAGFPEASMTPVSGRLPEGLTGAFFRNGPAQFTYGDTVAGHWFDGDGMVQRIWLGDGKASHSGQFVQTRKRVREQAEDRFIYPGFGSAGAANVALSGPDDTNAANTSVIVHAGKLYALWEGGSAYELDPVTLETKGPKVWREDLTGMPFLAHPKREPDGRLWNLAVGGRTVGIYRIGAAGDLERFDMVDIGAAAYIHDWAMTDRHLVILVQPWLRTSFGLPIVDHLEWAPDEGLRILIVDKDDPTRTRWAETPARFFYHTGAAWEDASGAIHIDIALYDKPELASGAATDLIRGGPVTRSDTPVSNLSRLVIAPNGDVRVEETGIDGEFPTVHPGFHGLARRYTALVGGNLEGRPGAHRLSVVDWQTGRASSFDYGNTRIAEEHLIVAKPTGRTEADAWVIGTALNTARQCHEVHVFDLAGVADGPIASFAADYPWPLGFHGTFSPA
ncbi:MAG: carotenoid oxygenase family protein [Pseudomonadota bacterium]